MHVALAPDIRQHGSKRQKNASRYFLDFCSLQMFLRFLVSIISGENSFIIANYNFG
jgi:hypothetical protein